MKYALIGCGRISPNHLGSALDHKLEIAAVCDVKEEKARALLQGRLHTGKLLPPEQGEGRRVLKNPDGVALPVPGAEESGHLRGVDCMIHCIISSLYFIPEIRRKEQT